MFWNEWEKSHRKKRRREPIPQSLRTELLLRCKGRCEKCGIEFRRGLKPHFHHKDEDPSNNKPSNIIVLCPNCHTKLHSSLNKSKHKKKKKRDPDSSDIFGLGNIFGGRLF